MLELSLSTHRLFDNVLFAVLLAIPMLEWRWVWPRFLRQVASGKPGVRLRFYRSAVLSQWAVALALLALWALRARPWSWLLLDASKPLRMGIGMAVAVLIVAFLRWQRVQVLGSDEAMLRVSRQLEAAMPLLPHTCKENRTFKAVSVTAGLCEELLFRGFLFWYLAIWTGPAAAAVLSSLLFGLGHLYLGPVHVMKTGLAGLFFSCLVFGSASLWPAILIHAAMDWNAGELGYQVLNRPATLA